GTTYVRFEGLETDNGPDLVVYLTKQPADAQAVGDDYLDLGVLKGNVGNQNYEVPAGVDLSEYDSVVIWCRRFAVSFGAAPVQVAA
ncbi:MAG: DM13 domain-containing protein, partial [Acidimicrobiales bacterium]|nr:DM13 domain-containing protein [Acidimicrobiales bacterium]